MPKKPSSQAFSQKKLFKIRRNPLKPTRLGFLKRGFLQPCLNPSQAAGTGFTYPRGLEG